MPTETEPISLQTGTTPNPIASNAQDFSNSDDEILDNFADGPDPNDDGTPMGLGGEKGRQSEPASSTLEADIVNGTTPKHPDEPSSDEPAGEPDPVQEPAGETGAETTPEPQEPETPEFPPALLQMAGYADATAAQAAGFQSPDALFAAVKWRSQLLTLGAQPTDSTEQGLYRHPAQSAPSQPAAEPVAKPEEADEVKPFQLPSERMELLDEDLQVVIRQMSDHFQDLTSRQRQELQSLRNELKHREDSLAMQQAQDEEAQFDQALAGLGDEWKDVFGEGSGAELARAGRNDPVAMTNFNHRALLFEAVEAVREVNARQGYKPMTLQQEMQWALMQRYPDKFQQSISGKTNGSAPRRRGVTASRPTQRNTPPTAKDKLLRDLHKKYPDAGFMQREEDEFDGEI